MGWKCLNEVFKEFIAVSLILILFNININVMTEIFKKIFLSALSKRDSRPEGEISGLFINSNHSKVSLRSVHISLSHFFNHVLLHGNPA